MVGIFLHQLQMSATMRALAFSGNIKLEITICSAFCYLNSSLETVFKNILSTAKKDIAHKLLVI